MPDISILTTSYNKEQFISECIESVLKSSHQNWEMIILDDCSTDSTYLILERYALQDQRIRIFKNDKNLGDYANRNEIVKYSNSEYIKYLDADDMIYPWAIEYILNYFKINKDICWALDSINQSDEYPFPHILDRIEIYEGHFNKGLSIFSKAPSSVTFKKDYFIKNNGFMELPMVGDMEFWLRLALNSKLMLLPHGFIWSRGIENNDSESARNNTKTEIILLYNRILLFYLKKIKFKNQRKIIASLKSQIIKILLKSIFKPAAILRFIVLYKKFKLNSENVD